MRQPEKEEKPAHAQDEHELYSQQFVAVSH